MVDHFLWMPAPAGMTMERVGASHLGDALS
jgi:hypothetical protein